MKTEKRFEAIDLIKLCVLLVFLLIPVILYLGSVNQQSEAARNEEIALEPGMGAGNIPSDNSDSQSKNPDDPSLTEGESAGITSEEPGTSEENPAENLQDGTGNFGDRNEESEQSGKEPSEGLPEDSPADVQSGEGESETSTTPLGEFPAPPVSGEALFLNEDEGFLYTPTGQIVYELDETGEVWVPVVPGEISDSTGGAQPEMSETGYWTLVDTNGEVAYIWEPGRLVWRSFDGSLIVVIPPTEGTLEGGTDSSETGTESGTGVSEGEITSGSGETGGTDSESSTSGNEGTGSSSTSTEGSGTETGGSTIEGGSTTGGTETSSGENSGSNAPQPVPSVNIPPELVVVPKIHNIHTGEFIYCLGRRFDVSPYDILRANGLYGGWIVPAGQKLTIPQNGDPFPAERALKLHPVMHTVQQSETIYTIACQYGDVFPDAIIYANNLVAPFILTPGTQIIIP